MRLTIFSITIAIVFCISSSFYFKMISIHSVYAEEITNFKMPDINADYTEEVTSETINNGNTGESKKNDIEGDKPETEEEKPVSSLESSSSKFALINQRNESVVLDSLMGKPLVMSFIFTRCPMPNMCPLIMQKVAKVQKELNKDYKDKVSFAILTFDPEYDTPEVLKRYGESYEVDFDNLIYLTGPKEDVETALEHFKVYAEEESDGMISHTMETMVMDEKGVIKRIFPTSIWSVKSVVNEVKNVIERWEKQE